MINILYRMFIFLVIFQIFMYSIIITPFILVYVLYHFLYFIIYKNSINNIYITLKWYSNIKIIKNILSSKSIFNPFYEYYISDKHYFLKKNMINNFVKIKYKEVSTQKIIDYTGKLNEIIPSVFYKIDNNYYRKEFVLDLNISEMYMDLMNFRKTKVHFNVPNEINDIIGSYLFSLYDQKDKVHIKSIYFKKTNNIDSMFGIQLKNHEYKLYLDCNIFSNLLKNFNKYESFIPVINRDSENKNVITNQYKSINKNIGFIDKLIYFEEGENIFYFFDSLEEV